MYKVGDMVKVNKELSGHAWGSDRAGKIAIVMESYKRTYIPSYWVKFFDGFECWVDENDLTIVSSCASI